MSLMAQEFAPYGNRRFVEDMRAVAKGDKYGFVNRAYEHVIPRIYLQVNDFAEGLAAVKLSDNQKAAGNKSSWIFINKEGKQAFAGTFDSIIHSFEEGLAAVYKDNKTRVINKRGEVIVEADPTWQLPFRKGLVRTTADSVKFGVANLKGQQVVPMVYDRLKILSPLAVLVYKGEKIGLLSNEGKELLAPQYDESSVFREGIVAVKKGDKWGFINEKGQEITPMLYDSPSFFVEGIASVSLNNEEFYIDKTGKRVSVNETTALTKKIDKPDAEKEFLDQLNKLVNEAPYVDQYHFEFFIDSPFVIRNKILTGTFRTYSPDGPVLQKITVPIVKVQNVWFDYYAGLSLDEPAALIQTTQPGKKDFDNGKTTSIIHLSLGEEYINSNKLQSALTALKASYKK
jgi:hypothetical protein